ncbi:hypothetical protein Ctob_003176 [Chrysochromulina tobinii]|uniref:Uncharacterized protein n=1 Tax=Chrysochromulina tobinii TaxID=1460289 RepID=A0A0M0JLM5_9EUKA|nr:hypothetical protein Ctob_003176 [Chrysochromulina tobinii]|eukprot:KOO27459.1 hypothetical protein Ctob_003176 [Chrysochromulina sp. CCMP291]
MGHGALSTQGHPATPRSISNSHGSYGSYVHPKRRLSQSMEEAARGGRWTGVCAIGLSWLLCGRWSLAGSPSTAPRSPAPVSEWICSRRRRISARCTAISRILDSSDMRTSAVRARSRPIAPAGPLRRRPCDPEAEAAPPPIVMGGGSDEEPSAVDGRSRPLGVPGRRGSPPADDAPARPFFASAFCRFCSSICALASSPRTSRTSRRRELHSTMSFSFSATFLAESPCFWPSARLRRPRSDSSARSM